MDFEGRASYFIQRLEDIKFESHDPGALEVGVVKQEYYSHSCLSFSRQMHVISSWS